MKYILITVFIILISGGVNADFSDTYNHPYKESIDALSKNGAIEGYKDGKFGPNNKINRAEFLKIIIAYAGLEKGGSYCFKDVSDEWFAPYVCKAFNLGLIEGYGDGYYRPGIDINFVEASKIITKVYPQLDLQADNKKAWYAPYVGALAEKKIIPTSILGFDHKLSRAELSEILYRLTDSSYSLYKNSLTYEDLESYDLLKLNGNFKQLFRTFFTITFGHDLDHDKISNDIKHINTFNRIMLGESDSFHGKLLSPELYKDDSNIYCYTPNKKSLITIKDADYKSFEVDGWKGLAYDKNHIYLYDREKDCYYPSVNISKDKKLLFNNIYKDDNYFGSRPSKVIFYKKF